MSSFAERLILYTKCYLSPLQPQEGPRPLLWSGGEKTRVLTATSLYQFSHRSLNKITLWSETTRFSTINTKLLHWIRPQASSIHLQSHLFSVHLMTLTWLCKIFICVAKLCITSQSRPSYVQFLLGSHLNTTLGNEWNMVNLWHILPSPMCSKQDYSKSYSWCSAIVIESWSVSGSQVS
jgi:hypothetical protein